MDAYVFQAALLCGDCGEEVCRRLTAEGKAPEDPHDESSFDSGDYPKGPYANGGGEADSPCHCDHCNIFLENPLTSDGEEYVRENCQGPEAQLNAIELEWKAFYSYLFR